MMTNQIQKYEGGKLMEALQSPKMASTKGQDINTFLLKTYFLLGIERPTTENQKLLIELFKVEFADYTLKEIEMAFTLARKGLIDYDLKLYGKPFSIQYVAELMFKYRKYRNEHKDYKNFIQIPEEIEPSKEEIFIKMRAMVLGTFNKFKENQENIREITYADYNFIEKHGFLFVPSLEQKKEAMKKAAESIANEDNENKKWAIKTKGIIAATRDSHLGCNNKQRVTNRAKELIVIDYFKSLIEMDKELELPENV